MRSPQSSEPDASVGDLSGVALGSVIGGRYRVERVLGMGGMGTVFEGRHLGLDQPIAVKVLRADRASNREHLARFAREARAAASVESEHTVRVLDVGSLDAGAPFMVLELLRGIDLARLLRQGGPLPLEQAVSYVLTVCEVLAEAHRKGIVHRDLKPSNLFLAQRSDGSKVLKVLDFGVAKFLDASSDPPEETKDADGDFLTNTSSVVGSPQYIAPEQIRNARKVDTRVDIWALGVVLFRLLTKRYPFVGATPADLYASILVNPAIPLRSESPSVPAEVEAIVNRCLEKNPEDRYPDVVELAAALAPFVPGSADTLERIRKIVAGETPGSAAAVHEDDEMELDTVDLMLDATVVMPPPDEHLTTSAGLSTSTDASRIDQRSLLPFFFVALGILLTLGVAAVVVFLLPTKDSPPTAAAAAQAPPPSPPSSAPVPDPEPPSIASASSAPAAVPMVATTPAATAHPPKTFAKPAKPISTPKPALSEIPSYGGRK